MPRFAAVASEILALGMSQENVELVRRFFEFAAQRRLKELRGAYTPDFVLREASSMPEAENFHGPEAMEQWSRKWATMFDYTYVPREIHDAGEQVLVEAVVRGRGKQSGAMAELNAYLLWTLHNGKFSSVDTYLDRMEAFKAAGLMR
jgi:ketosteroid isomerase-like protein